MELRNPMT